jgi:hypothetical protein
LIVLSKTHALSLTHAGSASKEQNKKVMRFTVRHLMSSSKSALKPTASQG